MGRFIMSEVPLYTPKVMSILFHLRVTSVQIAGTQGCYMGTSLKKTYSPGTLQKACLSSAHAVKFDRKEILFWIKCELSGIHASKMIQGRGGRGAVPTTSLWPRWVNMGFGVVLRRGGSLLARNHCNDMAVQGYLALRRQPATHPGPP